PSGTVPFFEAKIWETDSVLRPEEIYHAGYYKDNGHAYVVISEGCSNFCSYCVVPYVRGALRNRESQDILEEIKQALAQGISSVTLLGQNVNAYQNNGINFVKLVELVNSLQGLKDFSFITSHPKDTTEELFIAMRDCQKLTKHLHLPLQSGSDKILRLMNRGYSRKYYLDLIAKYRKIVKGGKLSSDIIVGFPGENEDDFANTRDLVLNARFNSAYIFKYSPRPNTAAEKLPDDVPRAEKERRHSIILELQKKISHKFKA
ncbi:MAG: MiaB/RimO family radical SAM methylthiotransferase, partial [Candidatus Omnitrophota bacterium]